MYVICLEKSKFSAIYFFEPSGFFRLKNKAKFYAMWYVVDYYVFV